MVQEVNNQTNGEFPQMQIINRVSSFPLVKGALGYATHGYEMIKGYNSLVSSTLSLTEQSINYVAATAKPVVSRFEKPLTYADSIACQGLDLVENKIPVLKETPEAVLEMGRQKYEGIKKYGQEKVQELKDYGYQKAHSALANQYTQSLITTVDSAVTLTEKAVDHYLPANEEESQTGQSNGGDEQLNVVQKISNLSDKMRRRMLRQAILQLHQLQKRSAEAMEQIKPVDLIQYAKHMEEAGRKKISEGVTTIQSSVKRAWDELSKEEETSAEGSQTMDQQLLSIARRTTRRVIDAYHNLGSVTEKLPDNVKSSLEASSNYAKEMYNQLNNVKSVKELSDLALIQMAKGAEMMQSILLTSLSPYLPTIEWFTPKDGQNQHEATNNINNE